MLPRRETQKLTEATTPSQVVPVLVAALICDVAVADPASGKKNLIGIFDTLWAHQLPTARPMSLYLKVTDAEGRYSISVPAGNVRLTFRAIGHSPREIAVAPGTSTVDVLPISRRSR